MVKPISILDKDYTQWLKELTSRYRQGQIKAAVKVNQELTEYELENFYPEKVEGTIPIIDRIEAKLSEMTIEN